MVSDLIEVTFFSFDFIHRLVFNEILPFGSRLCFHLQVKESTQCGGRCRKSCSQSLGTVVK
jgi:hypothetical protein